MDQVQTPTQVHSFDPRLISNLISDMQKRGHCLMNMQFRGYLHSLPFAMHVSQAHFTRVVLPKQAAPLAC